MTWGMKKAAATTGVEKEYLSVEEAAALVNICRQVIYDMVKRKDLKAARFGTKKIIRIRRADLMSLFDGGASVSVG